MTDSDLFQSLGEAIIAGEVELAADLVRRGLAAGTPPLDLINHGVVAAAGRLGDMFQNSEIFLPELVYGGKAAKGAMEILTPLVAVELRDQTIAGKVVVGTVFGDIHDIGKNLVVAMLGARGLQVHDLGVNVAPKLFVARAKEIDADIIALSALMSTSLYYQRDVISYLVDAGCRDKYYVVVGGGPVTTEWAREIGADGCARDATGTVKLCVDLLTSRPSAPLAEPLVYW